MSYPVVSGSAHTIDRRKSRRFLCEFDIAIEWGAAVLHGTVKELSATGMFVELDAPLWIGAGFSARLILDQPVALDCMVRRVEPRRGMAITFEASEESGRSAMASLLDRLSAG